MLFSLPGFVVASPTMPVPEVDITGTVASLTWEPDRIEKGIPGMSGTLGGDRLFKAAYQVILKDCKVVLSDPTEKKHFPYYETGKKEQMRLRLEHQNDDGFLKKGMKIKVENFHSAGDEGGIWTTYKEVKILEEPQKQKKQCE
jgi:hypothetical protein